MSLRRVTLLDTSVATPNLGDEIIVDAVRRHIDEIFAGSLLFRVGTHDGIGAQGRKLIKSSEVALAAGTNLLTSRMWWNAPWPIGPLDALSIRNVVLMGCGWYQYQNWWDPYSHWLLTSVLSKTAIHATRDAYSRDKLKGLGIKNVINAGCPTLWDITPEHCLSLPKVKAREVVTTINTHFRNAEIDRRFLALLKTHYERVHIWIQKDSDLQYANDLAEGLVVVEPSLAGYDRLLESHDSLDYIGNRLHGGIRALQKGRRAVIVEVDNRAAEMGRDFDLPTVKRDDFARIEAMITSPSEISVKPPMEDVARWKAQFA